MSSTCREAELGLACFNPTNPALQSEQLFVHNVYDVDGVLIAIVYSLADGTVVDPTTYNGGGTVVPGDCHAHTELLCDVANAVTTLPIGITTNTTPNTAPTTVVLAPSAAVWTQLAVAGPVLGLTVAGATLTNDTIVGVRVHYGTGYQEYGNNTWYDWSNEPTGHYEATVYLLGASGNIYGRTVEIDWNASTQTFTRLATSVGPGPVPVAVGQAFVDYVGNTPAGPAYNADGSPYTVVGTLQANCPPVRDDFLTQGDERGGNGGANCQNPSVEYQTVTFTANIAAGDPAWAEVHQPATANWIDVTNPTWFYDCGSGPNTYPITVEVSGSANGSATWTTSFVINTQADWIFAGGAVQNVVNALNSNPDFGAANVYFLNDGSYAVNTVFVLHQITGAPWWFVVTYTATGTGCQSGSYGIAYDGVSNYDEVWSFSPHSTAAVPPPGGVWAGALYANPAPVPAFQYTDAQCLEVVKCINGRTVPPTLTLYRYTLDGLPFTIPVGSTDVNFFAGCPEPQLEVREVCVDSDGEEAYLVLARNPITGEVLWTKVEDANGAEIVGATIVDCTCPVTGPTLNRQCTLYTGTGFGGTKDFVTYPVPCGSFDYSVQLLYGATLYTGTFSVTSAWNFYDAGYGVAMQSIDDGINALFDSWGVDIEMHNMGRVVLWNTASPDWHFSLTESVPGCDPQGLDPVFEYFQIAKSGATVIDGGGIQKPLPLTVPLFDEAYLLSNGQPNPAPCVSI